MPYCRLFLYPYLCVLFSTGNYTSAPNNESYFKLALRCCLRVSFWVAWFLGPSLAIYQREIISRLQLPKDTSQMAGREDYGNFVAISANISRACNYFESLRRRACRHVGWPYSSPLPIASRDEGNIWVALSSTCPDCHQGFVSMPRGSFLLWRGYIPIRCDHGSHAAALELGQ